MSFHWTPRRDRDLISSREMRFTFAECANMLGCTREEATARMAELRQAASAPAAPDLKTVPRPPAPAPRPGLIDISKAPSSMELAAKRWAER